MTESQAHGIISGAMGHTSGGFRLTAAQINGGWCKRISKQHNTEMTLGREINRD
ncbi:hypothetical protein DY000_02051266 [Brassica cretica]|uniref:Uncharacterized protein n=1 Tax=Brassica cretica TaxID=69181 RepID=A0ABQ7EPP2_BRACR|nr:hypothetical protein DY000_02051266 [Brassica cretica]